MKKYNWILSTCLIFYSNLTASVLTISPISVPSDIAGIYKIKSAVASFTNGSTLSLTEAQLNGSKFVISTDGIIASVTVYNGEVISTTFGYFTNLTNTTATVYNLSDAASYAKPYTKIGNTLSVTTTTLEFTEIDTYEKIATIDSAFIHTESDLINSVDSTKLLCKENPTLCGIQEVKAVTAEDINNLESGWHLVGTSQAITDLSVFNATNHAGADVKIINTATGEVREVQLKATEYLSYVKKHNERYEDIEVFATSEVASQSDNIHSSGISLEEVNSDVSETFEKLDGATDSQVSSSMAIAAMIVLAKNAKVLLRGDEIPNEKKSQMIKDGTIAAGTAAIVSLLMG